MYDAIFISDLHLGSKFVSLPLLESFLTDIAPKTKHLFLLGDVFDFWKDKRAEKFSHLFKDFKAVTYIVGNHDLETAGLSFLTNRIKTQCSFLYQDTFLYLTHGHEYDPKYGIDSHTNRMWDWLFYKISCLLRRDIRKTLHFLAKRYYDSNFPHMEQMILKAEIEKTHQYLIMGHTHCPGVLKVNDLKIFNLGSWLTSPYTFVLKGNQYAFYNITEQHLCPEEKDFNYLR